MGQRCRHHPVLQKRGQPGNAGRPTPWQWQQVLKAHVRRRHKGFRNTHPSDNACRGRSKVRRHDKHVSSCRCWQAAKPYGASVALSQHMVVPPRPSALALCVRPQRAPTNHEAGCKQRDAEGRPVAAMARRRGVNVLPCICICIVMQAALTCMPRSLHTHGRAVHRKEIRQNPLLGDPHGCAAM